MIDIDAEGVSWPRVILAFGVVFGLIGIMALALKRVTTDGLPLPGLPKRSERRLEIMETLPIDARRRLLIVRADGEEHLLFLGVNQDIVVKSGLRKKSKRPSSKSQTRSDVEPT